MTHTVKSIPESPYISPVWKDGIFESRVAFVTGGAGTICSMQTRALVRLGASACIIGRSIEKTKAVAYGIAQVRPGARVIAIGGCDVRKIEDLHSAAARCVAELGGIDFVIAGAAGNFVAPIETMSPNAFKTVIDIDVLGSFNTVKATMPHLLKSPDPRIIYMSAPFHYTGMPLQAHASAAKAAIDSLMASVSLEYGPRGVRSNVIAPGAIAGTEGMTRLGSTKSDEAEDFSRAIPLGRMGTTRDVADATVFLFSPAGSYINGQCLVVDGGGWRRQGANMVGLDKDMRYPDFLLSGRISNHVNDARRKSAPKL